MIVGSAEHTAQVHEAANFFATEADYALIEVRDCAQAGTPISPLRRRSGLIRAVARIRGEADGLLRKAAVEAIATGTMTAEEVAKACSVDVNLVKAWSGVETVEAPAARCKVAAGAQ